MASIHPKSISEKTKALPQHVQIQSGIRRIEKALTMLIARGAFAPLPNA
jgi:hypothetical protein